MLRMQLNSIIIIKKKPSWNKSIKNIELEFKMELVKVKKECQLIEHNHYLLSFILEPEVKKNVVETMKG